MQSFVLKILTIGALLAAEAWYLKSREWEPLITMTGLLVSLLGFEIRDYRHSKPSPDEAVFLKFLETLPSNGSIRFVAKHRMRDPFPSSALDDLRDFKDNWTGAEFSFLNRRLEKKRQGLVFSIEMYLSLVATRTYPTGKGGYLSVPSEQGKAEFQRVEMTVAELERKGRELATIHQDLVRSGRKSLRI